MRLVSILAVTAAMALGLSACQPADTPETVDAAETAATDVDALPTSDDGPDAFVHNLYTAMANDGPAPLGEEGLWSRAAWADIEAYQATDSGGFNADPLCNCQDPAGVAIRDLAVTQTGADSADAAVTITQGEAQTSMVLNLVREEGGWRIDDIAREGDPDFRAELARWTAEAQAGA